MSDADPTVEPAPTPSPASAPPGGVRWTMRILALGALGGSAVLSYQSLGQPVLPGCGPASGCDAVLNSAWANWFGVPVSVPAMALYGAMLAATAFIGPGRSATQRRWAWSVLWIGAVVALGAALWFGALQAFVLGAFCRYCTGVHVTASALAVLVFALAPRASASGAGVENQGAPPLSPSALTMTGLVLIAALGFGQAVAQEPAAPVMRASVLDGRLSFEPGAVPSLGAPDAEVWMVYLFDYTCSHCRRMHPHLSAARERYGDQLGIILLPTPLDAECNPLMSRTPPAAEHACELATLAMAVWRAEAEQFAAFDHWIYHLDEPPTPEAARARAVELVGETPLEAALDSGWPQQHIANSMGIYQRLAELTERTAVPTLIVGSAIFGATPDAETLFEGLETHSPLEAPADHQPAADADFP